jgi:hypothetical protein
VTPIEIKTIHELLANRVVPQSAREGAAIMQLAAKLVSHFAKEAAAQHDASTEPQPAEGSAPAS